MKRRLSHVFAVLSLVTSLMVAVAPAAHAAAAVEPASVTIAGSLQSELGCPGDWQPDCAASHLTYDAADGVWSASFALPAGAYEYKAVIDDSWDENYPGGNLPLNLDAPTTVTFFYDHGTHWVTDDQNSVIATAAGSFQDELGCPGDWQPDCLRSWLQDPDGDGVYRFSTTAIPAGTYEFKVTLNQSWDTSYPGSNVAITVGAGETVAIGFDAATTAVTVEVTGPPPTTVAIAGSLQSELGCPGDWQPDCSATELIPGADDGIYQATFTLPAGTYEYKAAIDDSWDENYGAGAQFNGPNILLVAPGGPVTFYYDHASHWVTDNVNSTIATVAGSFQQELGCPGDWSPDCLRSWMQDPDGDGVYVFASDEIPVGGYEFKVALGEGWDVAFPGGNVGFTVAQAGQLVTFSYDSADDAVTVDVAASSGLEPGDEDLVTPVLRSPISAESFYFVLPDRFANGSTANDTGGDSSGDPLVNGFLPTDKGYYHGGDLAGLTSKLDYLAGLGITAIWMTPQFTNRWIQGDGTIGGSSAAYHGYWQVDYDTIDPHFGSNAEMDALIAGAHARDIKVFFDIVANHTGDVIETPSAYVSKADSPYRRGDNGEAFDDRDYAGTATFPPLDSATSFPYVPAIDPADATVKDPLWLNDPIYYHNRGNSSFTGENSLYGDFFGLDDLFTEHPDVVTGMTAVFTGMIDQFGIDGFRVDTVKHVNDEFWETVVPAVLDHATAAGNPDFFVFGEVFDGDPAYTSRFTTELPFPSLLDFGFDGAAQNFAARSAATDGLRDFFAGDDWYTDGDSNASTLVKFIGNHDVGRFGWSINGANPGAADAERLARLELGYGLMYLTRGIPIVYYGDEQGFTGDGGDKDARQDMFGSQVASYNDDDLIGTTATTADDNFDPSHPMYATLADLAALRVAHPALVSGAQVHRYSQASAGIYAFSRIDRDEQVEYVVVLNNAAAPTTATFATSIPGASFTEVYPGGESLTSTGSGEVTVSLDGLSFAVYRADVAVPAPTTAPAISMTAPAPGAAVTGRVEIAASTDASALAEVTFAVKVGAGDYAVIGTDDSAPYRVFYDVSGLGAGTSVTFKAIVDDGGNLNAAAVPAVVGEEIVEPPGGPQYAVIHYSRTDGDYGDHTTGISSDFWGLHLWGDAIDPAEGTEWTTPKPFLGEDEYGRFAWIKLADPSQPLNFIVHRGDTKDGTTADRAFNPGSTPEVWLKQGSGATYTSRATAQGYVTIRYQRNDGAYDNGGDDYWGLHLWGDGIDPAEGTSWDTPKRPSGVDDFGAFWDIALDPADVEAAALQAVNFIVHKPGGDDTAPGGTREPGGDRSFIPAEDASVWLIEQDATVYPSRGAAEDFVVIHYRRDLSDYGDPTSPDFNDFWGMHVWAGAASPNPSWQQPVRPGGSDLFGVSFKIDLVDGADELAYILHRGDAKDPGPDQFLDLTVWGHEVWQLQGADPETLPYVVPVLAGGIPSGDISQQQAYWVDETTIAWDVAPGATYALHYDPAGALTLVDGAVNGGSSIPLTLDPAGLSAGVKAKFPHLASLRALKIAAGDAALVPGILTGQLAVSATGTAGPIDATGLQIPGVLDDLYTYDGDLGVTWDGGVPTIAVWAPTARSVTFHLFDDADPATIGTTTPMTLDPATGVWSITGQPGWKDRYYLFEVEVYVHSTGQVEHNVVTDPYSLGLAANSARSLIVDLSDPALQPDGWAALAKPAYRSPEQSSLYELHIRDFSIYDQTVAEPNRGTYLAFAETGSNGMRHLSSLADAGLTYVHLLPSFDIATIEEIASDRTEPDPAVLNGYPPDSDQQQALIGPIRDLDGFNWGYDPLHYTAPEGSYATDPDGAVRNLEYRQMVQALNETGLRVVMDVVYNHTNASGQSDKSVLDRLVPGYYHRLNADGEVETSTCCQNTATEHSMMEKLMIDSVVTWARDYKVDGFRFDLMGHHSKANMLNLRAALDALTLEDDGVDGSEIYVYGEGWDFGEVAGGVRFEQATQPNMAGTGIGTFNDRLRDAVRGGGPFDSGQDRITNQGFINGLSYDPNGSTPSFDPLGELLLSADQIRVGLTGNLKDYSFVDRTGTTVTGSQVDYNGSPSGYTLDPQESITYVSAHDNETLFDISQYKHPIGTSMQDRVRAQIVGLSTVALGQGVAFFHAGSDLLRSKSLDRDSYNSSDWFNRLDFTYGSNNWGVGLPMQDVNGDNWSIMQPLLANPALAPAGTDIEAAAAGFRELLEIRSSTPLFALGEAAQIQDRLEFWNTGPSQTPGLIVMSISDLVGDDLDPQWDRVVALFNATDETQTYTVGALVDMDVALHPVQAASADPVLAGASFDADTGTFSVPARTTAVFVQAPRLVEVTFTVTVPAASPGTIHVVGGFPSPLPSWDPAGIALTKVGPEAWSAVVTIPERTEFEYKYTRGSWETVEKQADGNAEEPNRPLVVGWGSDGTQTVNDAVANWRDPIVVSVDPPAGDGGVPIETVISATWNQAMSASVAFQVTGPNGPVSGAVGYDGGTHTTTFTPVADLRPGSTYTVVLADQVDAGGDVQQVPRAWSFTTRDAYPVETIEFAIQALAGIDHKKVVKAVERLEKALDAKYWLSATRLDPKHGKHVFDELRKAVKELGKVREGDPDRPIITGVVHSLVMLAGSLAQAAIDEAVSFGGDQKDVAKARKELAKASKELTDHDYDKAIDHFGKAWKHALKALK